MPDDVKTETITAEQNEAATDESLDLTAADFNAIFGTDEAKPESTTTEAQPAQTPEPTATAEAGTTEVSAPTADPWLDKLFKEEEAAPVEPAAPQTEEQKIQYSEREIQTYEAQISDLEQKLQQADPTINPDGSKLEKYTVDDRSIYELSEAELNQTIAALQGAGQAVMAGKILDSWKAYQTNKATIENQRKNLPGYKQELAVAKEQVEWAKKSLEWKGRLKAAGVEPKQEWLNRIDEELAAKAAKDPAFSRKTKDEQIFEALKSSGVAAEIKKAQSGKAQPAPTKAPDANAPARSVSITVSPDGFKPPEGFLFTEKQIRAMPRAEYERREAEIDRAQAKGLVYNDA